MRHTLTQPRSSDIGELEMEEQSAETVAENVKLARLITHLRENNIAWIAACYVAWQMGILDKLFTYGSGVCS